MHPTTVWVVIRQDDNGNVFIVASYASEAEARAAADEFEARGHKQMYSVVRRDELEREGAGR